MTDMLPFTSQMAPHSQEAEEAVLGSVLINPEAYHEVAAFLTVDDFFLLRNCWVWESMTRLASRNEIIEYVTVTEDLKNLKRLDDIGGLAYLTYLIGNTPSSVYAEAYGRIVQRAALRRRLLEAAEEINTVARQEESDINEVLDAAEAVLFKVTERRTEKDLVPMSAVMADYFDKLENLYSNRGNGGVVGIPSGFRALDNLLAGFQKGNLVLVAGRPGTGKTSLMLNMAVHAARLRGRVAFFSLEMGNDELMQRITATEININQHRLKKGELDEREWERFVDMQQNLAALPLFLDDTPAQTILKVRTKCRRMKRETGLDVIYIDYLGLLKSGLHKSNGSEENRVAEVSFISRSLKELARELNVPIIAASQLNRELEKRTDKRPMLSDLRDSGSLEQDADIVLFIYRDDMYNEASERPNEADLIIAKHRNGPTGTVELYFNRELTKFSNLRKDSIDLMEF